MQKNDTGKERVKKNGKTRPVRELQSPPHGFMVVERAHGKVNQVSCSLLLSTLNSVFLLFFFLGSREASYLPNLVGLSNAHFLAFVWLGKVRRPRKSCEGAEAGDVWRARPTPDAHAGRVAISQPGAG